MRVLFFGDIEGRPGRKAVSLSLPGLCEKYQVDLVGANVENAAGGFGITKEIYDQLLAMGIDFMTSGNHVWDKKETVANIQQIQAADPARQLLAARSGQRADHNGQQVRAAGGDQPYRPDFHGSCRGPL